MQLSHYNTIFTAQKHPITVVCENVTNAPNIGSLFRICDAFGVQKLIFTGEHLPIPSRKMQKTSRATEKYVDYQKVNDIQTYLATIKETHQIICLEISDNSTPIQGFSFNFSKPIALIIGDENFGVSENVLQQSDAVIHINMFGKNSSMNVVQATNIALYEMTKQFQK